MRAVPLLAARCAQFFAQEAPSSPPIDCTARSPPPPPSRPSPHPPHSSGVTALRAGAYYVLIMRDDCCSAMFDRVTHACASSPRRGRKGGREAQSLTIDLYYRRGSTFAEQTEQQPIPSSPSFFFSVFSSLSLSPSLFTFFFVSLAAPRYLIT